MELSPLPPFADNAEHAARWAAHRQRLDAARAGELGLLRGLVAPQCPSWHSDAVVARVAAMLFDLAAQLGSTDTTAVCRAQLAALDGLLGHLHSLALEALWLAQWRDQRRDPVLSPMLAAALAAEADVAATATRFLAAQARFVEASRRMALSAEELDADLLHQAIKAVSGYADEAKVAALRHRYDESGTRLALANRLLAAPAAADRVLAPSHMGLSLFASQLALVCGATRDTVVAMLAPEQHDTLAAALAAAGAEPAAIAEAADFRAGAAL